MTSYETPPKNVRVLVADAIAAAGNKNRLAVALGITRGAVLQWEPQHRDSPYLPIISAVHFLNIPKLKKRWKEIITNQEK